VRQDVADAAYEEIERCLRGTREERQQHQEEQDASGRPRVRVCRRSGVSGQCRNDDGSGRNAHDADDELVKAVRQVQRRAEQNRRQRHRQEPRHRQDGEYRNEEESGRETRRVLPWKSECTCQEHGHQRRRDALGRDD
jgi:hypothetical protein